MKKEPYATVELMGKKTWVVIDSARQISKTFKTKGGATKYLHRLLKMVGEN